MKRVYTQAQEDAEPVYTSADTKYWKAVRHDTEPESAFSVLT